jgi:predicted AlkP superfamily pyrophosphatase or phosphodiesterase
MLALVGRGGTAAELLKRERRRGALSSRALVAGLALSLGGAWARSGEPRTAAAETLRPRLVVFVSVDQMRADYLSRFAPLFQGGLKRFGERGAVFSNAYYRHANTETGPGHSVLLSGRHARDTGIVANEWYDRLEDRVVNVVDDPAATALPGPGRGASPAHVVGPTLGDLLKKASPTSRVVGVAMKDRSAILMAGPRADAAYWYETDSGSFGSSTYYMRKLPSWLTDWNAAGHIDALAGQVWTRLLPDESPYLRFAGPDDVRGEWDNKDTVFPHRIRGAAQSREFYDEVRRAPFLDELTLEVTLRAMKAHDLGRDEAPDILAVGMSATDIVGHTYGPDSQEIMDQLLRLDRVLGRLFEAAEAQAGRDRVVFGLSADHGSMPLVEVLKARGLDARRVSPAEIEKPVRQALEARFPNAGELVELADVPHFYLDRSAIARQGLSLAAVQAVAKEALLGTGVVRKVYTPVELMGDPPGDDPDFPLLRNSFFESRSPHVIATVKPYVYVSSRPGGTGHGTVHGYDRHVPVAFLGSGIKAGRYDAECGPNDIAPTLAVLLGVEYRVEEGQRVLSEALAPGAGASGATGGRR